MDAIVVCMRGLSYHHGSWEQALKFDGNDYLLCDLSEGTTPPFGFYSKFVPDNVINYKESNIRQTFRFQSSPDKDHWWSGGGSRNIIWFYPHLRMLYFYITHPEYDNYWFFDEDVSFPNDELYKIVEGHDKPYDFIAPYIFGKPGQIGKQQVLEIDTTMCSYSSKDHNWLTHFPGPGDELPFDIDTKFGSYFPAVRFSNRAMDTLLKLHTNGGYWGYSEGYVPTMLDYKGMSLYSMYNKESLINIDPTLQIYHRGYNEMQWKNL